MKKNFMLVLLGGIFCFQVVVVQAKSDSLSVELKSVDVTAQRNKLYSGLGRIVTVIEQNEIALSAVQSIDQLLDYVAGVDIRQRGTNGTQADVSIRGGSFDQVLVLLNGVNITDPQTGHFNLDIPVSLSDVKRVEILQGSSARVLGPNAFSGAINIVTESVERRFVRSQHEFGSYNTFGQSLSAHIGGEKLSTFASVNHKSSDGHLKNTDFDLSNVFVNSILNTDNTGKYTLQLAAQFKDFGENGFYSLKYPNQRENTKTYLASFDWSLKKGDFLFSAQTNWRRHHDRYELDHNTVAGYKYHMTDILGAKGAVSYTSLIGKTTVGLNVRNEHIFSSALGNAMSDPDSLAIPYEAGKFFKQSYNRTIYSGMIDHSVNLGKWYLSAGLATSYSEDFKSTTYGGVDVAYFFNDNMKSYASVNTASRLPTFTDLFFVNPVQQGNPLLKPEQSQTFEVGTQIHYGQWNLNADVFYRIGKNVIDWVKLTSSTAKYEAMNLSTVNALGANITADYNFRSGFLKKATIAYSYLTLDKAAVGFDSKYALDYLNHKVVLGLNHAIVKHLSASWNLGYFDRSGNYDANTVIGQPAVMTDYQPYLMLDCRLLWSQKKYDIFLDVNNILNQTYADFGGLTQPGRNFMAGVRLRLE